jgi:multidrug efflux system membrane fusion protein
MSFGLLDDVVGEAGEEAGDVRLLHEEFERELRRLVLNVGHAPRSLQLGVAALERVLELGYTIGGRRDIHTRIIEHLGRAAHRPKGLPARRSAGLAKGEANVTAQPAATARLFNLHPSARLEAIMKNESVSSFTPARRRLALRAAVPLLLLAAVAACTRAEAQPGEPPLPKVTVANVLERSVTEWDEFTGRLEAVDAVAVRPRVSGYVSKVTFTEGAVVRKGDLLFQIDARPFQAEVDRLRAERSRADAVVDRAESELQRADRLRAENAMSREEFDRRSAFARESKAQVAAVTAGLAAAELNLEFTRVTAPISGRVGRAIVTEGNLVSTGPGEATLLTTLVSIDPIHAHFDADESIFLKYEELARQGLRQNARSAKQRIEMELAGETDYPRQGELDFLDNRLDPSTGTIRGRALFRNPTGDLTPGLFVRLRLPGTSKYSGLLIQDRAVGTDLDKRFVFVVKPDRTIEYRPVTLGPLVDGLRVVRDGLKPGEQIIVNGLQRVRPGATVDPVVEPMAVAATAAGQPAGKPAQARRETSRR